MSRTIHLDLSDLPICRAATVVFMTARTGVGVKEGFRDTARSRRSSIAAARRSAAATLIARRVADVTSDRAGMVLAYRAIGTELDLDGLTTELADAGRLALPRVVGDRLEVVPWRPGDELVRTRFGVEEPTAEAIDIRSIDVVLVPGLAFDLRCFRLGYGGGFYDRLLAAPGCAALAVGVGFDEQLVDRLPVEPHDRAVDVVVTDRRTVLRPLH